MALSSIRRHAANNLSTLRTSPISEISGALGDLGTLLPLMIALAIDGSISLSATLVFSGLWNIMNGVIFGIPLPVQPMKAIAAVAIAQKLSIEENISAGFATSGVVFILSVTGLLEWFSKKIPVPVIKGIQLGAGLSLIITAGSTLLQPLGLTKPSWHDNLLLSILAFLLVLGTRSSSITETPILPTALIIFLLGIALSHLNDATLPHFQLYDPQIYRPTPRDFLKGALSAGLGQIPLTTLNSIIAIPSLCASLLPLSPTPSVTSIGLSVSIMNLLGGSFGAMPVCHGSGGLAAQYRFGARSGASVILFGTFKLLLGFLYGDSLLDLLKGFPKSLLGVLVIAAGLELAGVGEELNHDASDLVEDGIVLHRPLTREERKERWTIMLTTVAGILAFKNDGVGFALGMLAHFSYRGSESLSRWVERRRGASSNPRPGLSFGSRYMSWTGSWRGSRRVPQTPEECRNLLE